MKPQNHLIRKYQPIGEPTIHEGHDIYIWHELVHYHITDSGLSHSNDDIQDRYEDLARPLKLCPGRKIMVRLPLLMAEKSFAQFSDIQLFDIMFGRKVLHNTNEDKEKNIERDRQYIKEIMPPEVAEALKNPETKLYANHGVEGWDTIDYTVVCRIFDILPTQLVWLTSLYPIEGDNPLPGLDGQVQSLYSYYWNQMLLGALAPNNDQDDTFYTWNRKFMRQLKLVKNKTPRPKLATSYMRRPRYLRHIMLCALKEIDVLDDLHWSYGLKVDGVVTDKHIKHRNASLKASKIKEIFKKETLDWLSDIKDNVTCDGDDYDLNNNLAFGCITWDHIYNSYFMIVHETMPNGSINSELQEDTLPLTPFLSEKSYKPMAVGQPFVIHGDAGTIEALRQQGFHTFDSFINHDYDLILCPVERAVAVAKEIKRLSELPESEWVCCLHAFIDDLKNNKRILQNVKLKENTRWECKQNEATEASADDSNF